MRIYDTRAQRRPVAQICDASEFSLTALALVPPRTETADAATEGEGNADGDGRSGSNPRPKRTDGWAHDAIIADTAGGVSALDLRSMRIVGRYQVRHSSHEHDTRVKVWLYCHSDF